jgi:hypothetical protein
VDDGENLTIDLREETCGVKAGFSFNIVEFGLVRKALDHQR